MRNASRLFPTTLALLYAALAPRAASAQVDVNPPLPNVLLLVDTSGSMEYMATGALPTNCTVGGVSDLNRWATLVSVLTGTINILRSTLPPSVSDCCVYR